MTAHEAPDAPFALVRVRDGDTVRPGVVVDGTVRPFDWRDLGVAGLNEFLADADWDRVEQLAGSLQDRRPLADVVLAAPVEPRQVVQAGANYRTHVIELVVAARPKDDPRSEDEVREEVGRQMDERRAHGKPYCFIGLPACVVGDDVPLVLPAYSDQHDWELELAVVIGREAYRVDRASAMDHVAGWTISNDITTRDAIFRADSRGIGADWYRGKNAPGFLPTGPFLVPARFADPADLHVTLTLNGDTMQDATTADLLFDVPALIAAASENMPLLPGDLLLTGSPSGNGVSHGRLLRDGDVMVGSIEHLGGQVVRCVADTHALAPA